MSLKGKVSSIVTAEPIVFATISLLLGQQEYKTLTNESGEYILRKLPAGTYQLNVSSLNFYPKQVQHILSADKVINIGLEPMKRMLNEVYVTASEAKGKSGTSVIDKKAMQLLQPSSFTDLLELLPGGRSVDPKLNVMNRIRLREATNTNSSNTTSSLGTAFYIDDAPINTTANMQSTAAFFISSSDPNASRDNTNQGVDMRSLSTDQIEKVEIVRGIPSVEYGDLTSGLVKIERKKGASPLAFRAKADGFSKLAALSKGFSFLEHNLTLNTDLDFLDAKANPTDSYKNYKRITASVRTTKFWENSNRKLSWSSAIDYSTSLDNSKTDPDNSYALTDAFKTAFQSYGLNNRFDISFKKGLFKAIAISTKINYQQDKIDLSKLMQARTATILANSLEAGAHDASFLTPTYVATMTVDGRPLNAFVKASTDLSFKSGKLRHSVKLGIEGNYSKNFGEGQVYDLNYPPNASITARPRAFNDIPAMQNASFFAEDQVGLSLGQHLINVSAGLRGMAAIHMDERYKIADKIYTDPRINLRWSLPQVPIGHQQLSITLGAGYGLHTKLPTLAQLYPDKKYEDLVQLNFYHNNPEFRKANVMTYIIDNTNFDLGAAVNKKWEISTDASYDGNRLSVTYFKENMRSGFIDASRYKAMDYKKYDNTSIDASNLTAAPSLDDFKYENRREFYSYGINSNGGQLIKEGVEYQFTSKRISQINTRFTINGAWYKTRYLSSLPVYQTIKTDVVTDGKVRQYIGIYDENSGTAYSQFNTNLSIDSYLPRVGLMLFISLQSLWFTSRQSAYNSGIPVQYMDINENIYPYTAASLTDVNLKWLNKNNTESQFRKDIIPVDMQMNLKASKVFKNSARVSLFVNRIFVYTPDYDSYFGTRVIRQGLSTPYFGMELNFNL